MFNKSLPSTNPLSSSRLELPVVTWVLLAIAVFFTLPLYDHPYYWGIQDWDANFAFDELIQDCLLKYHQIPLWNPYMMGGMPMLAEPESSFISIAQPARIIFGVVLGAKVNLTLHLFLGLLGGYLLARKHRLEIPNSLLTACVFMLSSMYPLIAAAGMEWGSSLALIPWVLFFYLSAYDDFRYSLATAVTISLMWLGGGVYPFTISLLLVGTHAVVAVCCRDTGFKKAFSILATIYGLTFALAAIKFLPAMEFMFRYPRYDDLYCGFSLESLLYGLFNRNQTLAAIFGKSEVKGLLHGFSHGLDETGMYIGVLPFALFLTGAVRRFKSYRSLLICMFIFLWLSFGARIAPFSLWDLLRMIPPYSFMRTIERFRFVYILIISLMAGVGLQELGHLLKSRCPGRRWLNLMPYLIAGLVLLDLFQVSRPAFKDAFVIPPVEFPRQQSFTQIGGLPEYNPAGFQVEGQHDLHTTFGAAYPALLANLGSTMAYISEPVPENAAIIGYPGYHGEVFLEGAEGTVRFLKWTPNRLVVEVNAKGNGWLIVNQNYYPGWKAKGQNIEQVRGLLAVKVDPSTTRVELWYRPTSFVIGAIVSLLALLLTLGWFLWLGSRTERNEE